MMARKKSTELVPVLDLKQSAAYINAEHGAAEQAGQASYALARVYLEHACNAGEALLRQKESLRHGSLQDWIEENLVFGYRTAARYMQKAKEAREALKSDTLSLLDPAKAIGFVQNVPAEEDPETPPEEEEASPDDGEEPPDAPDEEDGEEEDEEGEDESSEEEPDAPPSPPAYPYSERLHRWILAVEGETAVIDEQHGGILNMLADPEKWDWDDVNAFLLPMLTSLKRTLTTYQKEIRKHAGTNR